MLIFGVTGMIGRAVAQSAVASPFIDVYGFTRQIDIDEGVTGDNIRGVQYVIGNMYELETVIEASKTMDVVFFSTFFWESMNSKTEYTQGYNVINAAVACGVKHLIYCTTDYNILGPHNCPFFEAKARLANYIVYTGIPFTLVRLSWFYENFFSVFRPHPTSRTDFAIALPMGSSGLNMGCLKDYAKCITLIALRPAKTINRTINLSSNYLTVKEIAKILNAKIPDYYFFDPQITPQEYQELNFKGAKELADMFRHYQRQTKWDNKDVIEYGFSCISFEDWVTKFKQELKQVLDEQIEENEDLFQQTSERHKAAFTERLVMPFFRSANGFRRVLPASNWLKTYGLKLK